MIFAYLDVTQWLIYACLGGILFCWAIEVIAAFRNHSPKLGAFSLLLSPIAGLIIGCVHAREWKITQVMIIFVGCILGLFAALLYTMYTAADDLSKTL
ncbi:MAG: hypothetical protein VX970_04280 [Planctomycetota bacterium]|nr:hypothetical protein [Planctomycetota bacterium]